MELYDCGVKVADWVAFGVLVVSFVGGAVVLGLRAFDTWRAFRSFRRTVAKGLGDLNRRVAGVETRVARLDENSVKLNEAQQRLRRSLATAAVLADAANQTRTSLGWLRTIVPRK
jgi:hypothetical protein